MKSAVAVLSAAQVEPLRKRIRSTRVLKETWEAIAQQRLARTRPMENEPKSSNPQPSSALAVTQDQKTVAAAKTPVIQPRSEDQQPRKGKNIKKLAALVYEPMCVLRVAKLPNPQCSQETSERRGTVAVNFE